MVDRARRIAEPADWLFVALAVGCGVTLLYLGRSLTFQDDEWRSITFDGGVLDYIRPVNQHWSTIPLLMYRGTFHVVGLHSYIPYLAEVVVLHLVAVSGAYMLMRRRVGSLVAMLAALPLLFLGSGAENLFWGFQTGFVGSVMFGVWGLFFLERPGSRAAVVASVLLIASLASSGMGNFFLVVAAGRTIFDSAIRVRTLAVAPAAVAYAVWFGLVGRDPIRDDQVFLESGIPRFAVRGVVHATKSISGLGHLPDGDTWGLVLFAGLVLLTGLRFARGRPQPLAAACLLGVAAMYTLIAPVRLHADPGYDHAISSRYVYIPGFLLVLAVVDLLPRKGEWALRGRAVGTAISAVLVAALGLAVAANVDDLRLKRSEFQDSANFTRAFVNVALEHGHETWVDRGVERGWMPSVSELEHIVARHGSPLHDDWFPGVVPAPNPVVEEAALLALVGDGFRVEQARVRDPLIEIRVRSVGHVTKVGRCARARFGLDASVWILDLPPRARVRVTSARRLQARLFLAHERGPGRRIFASFEPGAPRDVLIPDIGDARAWELGLDTTEPKFVDVALCALVPEGRAPAEASRAVLRRRE